ncbi:hypothetical protein ERD95_27195, partial [Enterobacteriaceae bacterium ML5]
MAMQEEPSISLQAKGNVEITANRSQAFVVLALVACIAMLFVGCFFIYLENKYFWIPFVAASFLFFAAVTLAILTHKNIDMVGAQPTSIEIQPNLLRFSADPKANFNINQFTALVTIANNMHALPVADGIVDANLNPILNSSTQANLIVENANKEAKNACDDIFKNARELSTPPLNAEMIINVEDRVLEDFIAQEVI